MNKKILEETTLISNEQELSEMTKKLNELKKSLDDSPINLIKKAIIEYLLIINPLSEKWKEEEIIDISNYLIGLFCEDKIETIIKKGITNYIKNPLLKYLIEIDSIFPEKKEYIKLCFQIILLSHNKELLIKYIKYFSLNNIDNIEKEILKLNYKNPFSIIFIHKLLMVLFSEENSDSNILDKIINSLKDIQIFRCSNCFDLFYILHKEEGTSLICNNSSHSIINNKALKQLNNYDLKCYQCKNKINIYCDNYKCLKCKNIVCNNCYEIHYNNCLLSVLINLYEVGYTCEIHNKKFIDFCELCNKNLCTECEAYHFHIMKQDNHLIKLEDEKLLSSVNMKKLNKTKNYIKYHLLNRHLYMKRFNFKNIKIAKSLHFIVNKENITYNTLNFYSKKFFDNEFQEYYKDIIEESKKGKTKEFEAIKLLENEYKNVKLFSESEEYNKFIDMCLCNQKMRNNDLNDIYFSISNLLLSIGELFYAPKMLEFEQSINNNSIDIILLKCQIIKMKNTNRISQIFIKRLLSRYFSDFIIRLLIKKYPFKFKKINLSLNNIHEIITTYGIEVLNNDSMQLIKNFIDNFLSQNNEEDKKKYLIEYIKKTKENNKVIFIDSINVNNTIIQKNELNFMLGSLLYFKKEGNLVAHPNIKSEIEVEIEDFSKKIEILKSKDLFQKNSISNENSELEMNLIDDSLKNEIKCALKKVKDEILEYFKDINFDKNADLGYILEYLFENKSQNITKKGSSFLRVIDREIDIIINDEQDYEINTLFNNEDIFKNNPLETLKEIKICENLINEMIMKFKDYNVKKNEKFEYQIKCEIKNLNKLSFYTFQILLNKYLDKLVEISSDSEKKAYILSFFGKEYIESDLFIKAKKKIISQSKEYIKSKIMKIKIKNIFKIIEGIDDERTNIDENSFIKDVKNYIKELNFDDCERISELNFDFKKITDIIKLLITEKNINWLVLSSKESTSISSYLYYMQNKKQ